MITNLEASSPTELARLIFAGSESSRKSVRLDLHEVRSIIGEAKKAYLILHTGFPADAIINVVSKNLAELPTVPGGFTGAYAHFSGAVLTTQFIKSVMLAVRNQCEHDAPIVATHEVQGPAINVRIALFDSRPVALDHADDEPSA